MNYRKISIVVMGLIVAAWAGYAANGTQGDKKVETRVFEMRTYYAHPGKMQALHARFRDHTNKLFVKHGMTLIGYWSPIDQKQAEQKMVYILAYPSKAAADKSWADFRKDPDWDTARKASEKDGPLVAKVESVFLTPTDYSPIK
jgi:NIPSNAP